MIDLDPFIDDVLDPDIFAEEGIFTPVAGASKTIKGVYENAFLAIGGLGDAGVASSAPTFLCKASDVVDAHRGDALYLYETTIHPAGTWYIQEPRPDGDGFTTLILSKD